jgi:nicotinamidase-related amidase
VAVKELPLPSFYNPARVGEIWRMPYQDRAEDARKWRAEHRIRTSSRDGFRVCLILIDVQNTFCIPGFELYVGGNTGSGAVDDNRRLIQFLYALVPALEEAIFFHTICRFSQPDFQIKGNQPLTENYSVLKPEIMRGLDDEEIVGKNRPFIQKLMSYDAVIIAGQAKSHCVAWTVADLLTEINRIDPSLAAKIDLLEDCTSTVVIPGVIDYSDQADSAFQGFSEAGMHLVSSTDSIST